MKAAILAAALFAFAAHDACGQYGGGRHRGNPQGDSQQQQPSDSKRCAEMPDDPFAAVERELPSLSLDIGLTSAQVDAWNAFARDVRDIAEIGRTRRRHVIGMRNATDAPVTTLALVRTISEDDRIRAEATNDLQRHAEALYAMLSEAQKRVLDKRLILSQTDPLGK